MNLENKNSNSNYKFIKETIGIVINDNYGGFYLPYNIKNYLINKGVHIKTNDLENDFSPLYYIRDNQIFVNFVKNNPLFNLAIEYIPITIHEEGYWNIQEHEGKETIRIDYKNYEKNKILKKENLQLKYNQNKLLTNIYSLIFNKNLSSEKKILNLKMLFPVAEEITIDKILNNFDYLPGEKIFNDAKESFDKIRSKNN
jgi:hypothetical protein